MAQLDKLVQGVEGEVSVLIEVATVATESAEKFGRQALVQKVGLYVTAYSIL